MSVLLIALGTAFMAEFPLLNPIGHVPMFFAMTAGDSVAHRRTQALRTSLYATLVLVIALLFGQLVLRFFGISLASLRIAGGLVVAHAAWQMLTATHKLTATEHAEASEKDDISLTPMAIPILSGPGAIGVAIGLAVHGPGFLETAGYLLGFCLLGWLTYICLRYGEPLVDALGENGVGAVNRILGLLILAIAVELIAQGVAEFAALHSS